MKSFMLRSLLLLVSLFSITAVFSQETVSVSDVVRLALEHNFDVRIERTFNSAAGVDKHHTYGAFIPRINGSASRISNISEQELKFQDESRNNQGNVRSNNITATVQANWTLFDGTRMFAAKERLDATEEQSQYLLMDQMTNTIASVIQNYYDIVRQKQQLKALQEQMAVSEERVKLADRKFQVGTGAKPELLQAKVDYNAQRTQSLQQESLIRQLKEQLNAMVDMKLAPGFDVADTIVIDLSLQEQQVLQDVEAKNFGLRAAQAGITIADKALWEQRAQGLPTVDLVGAINYNRQNNLAQINPFGPLFNLSEGLNFGVTVTVPFLNNMNNRRLIQQSRIIATRQQLIFDQQRVNVNAALRNAFVNYDNAKKILQVEEENIGLAKENVTIALEVFRRGASTFVELRTAQQSLADAYTRLINARYLAKVAETELLRLNGSLLK
jgi:outer membrane protein